MTTRPRPGHAYTARPPGAADVGIIAALSIEVAPLLASLKEVRKYKGVRDTIIEGYASDVLVAILITGPGQKRAGRGARLMLDGHRPRWLISAGFAGALTPGLQRNQLLFPGEILDEQGGRIVVDGDPEGEPRAGRLLTVDRIIRTAAEKRELASRHGADLVDMETFAVATACAERGQKFLSLRVVSDDVTKDLPPEVLSVLGQSGGYRVGAAFGALWKRPSSLFDLLTLREHAHEAADRLALAFREILPKLP